MLSEIDRKVRQQQNSDSAFDKWLSDPMTRMGISAIPAGERDDALRLLLRSAFNAGVESGAGNTAGEFLTAILDGILKDKKKPDAA